MKTSSIPQKVGASAINCTLVLLLTIPLYPLLAADLWKLLTVSVFFSYNMIFRTRCIGMRCVGTYIEPPTTFRYAALYSLGFATFFYSVWFPMDLLIANGILQVGSLAMTGNTLHGNFAGQGTMDKQQYLARAKARALLLWEQGHLQQAIGSIACDLNRYPELRIMPELILVALDRAKANDVEAVRDWIEGFE